MAGLTFLIVFLLLMVLVAIVPQVLRRFHVPSVVAIMLVGIVIGPNALDVIRGLNHFLGRGYPTEQIYLVLDAIGLLGLIFFLAGILAVVFVGELIGVSAIVKGEVRFDQVEDNLAQLMAEPDLNEELV